MALPDDEMEHVRKARRARTESRRAHSQQQDRPPMELVNPVPTGRSVVDDVEGNLAVAFASHVGKMALEAVRSITVDVPDMKRGYIPEGDLSGSDRIMFRAGQKSVYYHILSIVEKNYARRD